MDGLTGALEPMPGEWPVALCLIKVAAAIRSEPFARCICRDFSPKATLAPCTVSQVCGDPVSIHPNNPCTNLSSGTPTYHSGHRCGHILLRHGPARAAADLAQV